MMTYVEIPNTNIAEIMIDGKVTRENFDAVIPKIEALIEKHGTIRFLEEIRSFGGFELSMLWDDMKFSFNHLKDFERVAIVTDKNWIKNWSKIGIIFMKAEMKLFDLEDINDARIWLMEDSE